MLIAVSVTPGLCMMLALTLGATIGVRRTLWMMIGELSGLGLVSILAVTGVAAIMFAHPGVYGVTKVAGGLYLLYVGLQMARTDIRSLSPVPEVDDMDARSVRLMWRGFLTAISNPKAWLFYASLLPPFIRSDRLLLPQVALLISLLLFIEFISLLLYASCGQITRGMLERKTVARSFFILAGAIVFAFGVEIIVAA